MVKSKKPKKEVNLKPEYTLDPNTRKHNKQRKKNAPDRPQPEWMFPLDEENPVLNPKAKSDERKRKDKEEHDHALKFLKYKSVTTPLKAPPPARLLTLVGSFLTSYGFDSTSRLYTTELASREKLDEWKVLLDEKLPRGFPDLVKLFKVGQKTFEEQKKMEETSSSDSDDSDDRKAYKKASKIRKASKKATDKTEETEETTSSEGEISSEEGDSDEEMEDAPPVTKAALKMSAKKIVPSPSASSSSDSDADDEQETAGALLPSSKATPTPNVNGLVDKAKHKAEEPPTIEESADEDSSEISSSESESEEEAAKQAEPTTAPLAESNGDGSSSSSNSESEVDFSKPPKPTTTANTNSTTINTSDKQRNGSSSSETLKDASDQKPTTAETSLSSSSSSSDSDSADAAKAPKVNTIATIKRKRDDSDATPSATKQQKRANAPFERVPKDTPVDERFTNEYKSYDYADRAYQDLSVTKGKGFTKEKNKKKRGSYRGGAIDVGGGKGIKFDD